MVLMSSRRDAMLTPRAQHAPIGTYQPHCGLLGAGKSRMFPSPCMTVFCQVDCQLVVEARAASTVAAHV